VILLVFWSPFAFIGVHFGDNCAIVSGCLTCAVGAGFIPCCGLQSVFLAELLRPTFGRGTAKAKAKAKAKATAKAKTPTPAINVNAQQLQEWHGEWLAQPPYSECGSAFLLHAALHNRTPRVHATMAVVKVWWDKNRVASGQAAIKSAQDLEDKHGEAVHLLVDRHPFTEIYKPG
jgi:hypothetical protein